MVHVQRSFSGEPFDGIIGDRLRVAIDQLAGVGRAIVHECFGWWPVLFPGFPGPGGWHVDGSNFHHHLTSREQGLVTLFLFSDIGPGDGGTPVARGSHHAVARLLAAAEPPGLSLAELQAKLPPVDPAGILEVTGEAGDVAMLIRSKIRCSSIATACIHRWKTPFARPLRASSNPEPSGREKPRRRHRTLPGPLDRSAIDCHEFRRPDGRPP